MTSIFASLSRFLFAGYRSASHVCKNRVTGQEVEDALCDQTRRPEGEVEPCNTHRCPAK